MIGIKEDYRVIDKGADFIIQEISKIGDGIEITTGIHAVDFFKTPKASKTPVGVYAAMNEFGTKVSPPRPFMLRSMNTNIDLYVKQTMAAMRSLYNGGIGMEGIIHRQKRRTRKQMRDSIKNWASPDNAPKTKKRKRKKGRNEPLRDTDTMLRSISSQSRSLGGGLPKQFSRLLALAERRLSSRGLRGR